jgi:hypothetical protein
MSAAIEYNGYMIEPATRQRRRPAGWTLQVRITPVGRRTGTRRCRASNVYATQEQAIERCYEFGRQIVDGKLQPKAGPRL